MNQTSTSNLCIGEIQIEEREKNNKQVDKEKKKKTDIIWNDLYTVVLFSWNDGDRVDQSFRLDLTRLMCYFKFWSMSQPCIFMNIWFGFSSYEFQKFVSLIFSLSFYPFDGRTISPLSFIEMAFDALRVECNSQLHEAWKKKYDCQMAKMANVYERVIQRIQRIQRTDWDEISYETREKRKLSELVMLMMAMTNKQYMYVILLPMYTRMCSHLCAVSCCYFSFFSTVYSLFVWSSHAVCVCVLLTAAIHFIYLHDRPNPSKDCLLATAAVAATAAHELHSIRTDNGKMERVFCSPLQPSFVFLSSLNQKK